MTISNFDLRALVFHPKVDADERIGTDDVRARIVRGAVPLEVPRHRGLTPLGPVQVGRERQVLALKPDIVHATLGVVGVDLEGAHARVLSLEEKERL